MILDAGSGHNPLSQANVLCDRFVGPTRHRGRYAKMSAIRNRPFVCCDIQYLPFRSTSFSFVYCSHVLEHVDDPKLALTELKRVGKHGIALFPSGLWQYFTSNPEHRWAIHPSGPHKNLTKGALGGAIQIISRILRYDFRIRLREQLLKLFEYLLKRDIHESTIRW